MKQRPKRSPDSIDVAFSPDEGIYYLGGYWFAESYHTVSVKSWRNRSEAEKAKRDGGFRWERR